jgi:hypothetical protein
LSCYVTICLQRPPRARMCLSNSGNVIENEKTRSILPVGNRDPGRIFTNFSMTYQSRIKPMIECPTVGRVCSARARPNLPQTPPQNYPPDWERRATPTFPNQAGNPAFTFMSIRAFFAPDTPALRWAGRRAGVFCASETEIIPDTTAELPAGLGTPRHPNTSKPGG